METTIRKFEYSDIPLKVRWINDTHNNKYLHYPLPLTINGTKTWFEKAKEQNNRLDYTIECNKLPVGIIGLLNTDEEAAELYITLGEEEFKGKGVAQQAIRLLFEEASLKYGIKKIKIFTEVNNLSMQKLSERIGMTKVGIIKDHYHTERGIIDAIEYIKELPSGSYYLTETNSLKSQLSDIEFLTEDRYNNKIFMKRDDLIGFSFGGNKARKGKLFFQEILRGNYTTVVTYGSKESNHCRVIANACSKHNLKCVIISPKDENSINYNRLLVSLCGAKLIECTVNQVRLTIDQVMIQLMNQGEYPYFIQGGGHGNIGTQAYYQAYQEIDLWSKANSCNFDYIFFASGTGTTQAGLIVGQLLSKNDHQKIIGISIARAREYGSRVIYKSVMDYSNVYKLELNDSHVNSNIHFIDKYLMGGYGQITSDTKGFILDFYKKFGIALSTTYTGKALYGMHKFLEENNISEKNILFINTGGIPLFFEMFNKEDGSGEFNV